MTDFLDSSVMPLVPKAGEGALEPADFDPYLVELSKLLNLFRNDREAHATAVHAALDGQPGRELRRRYSGTLLRATGTFFTGSELAQKLVDGIAIKPSESHLIIDPACGAGDLLVACARRLPTMATLSDTLTAWGKQLFGYDINRAFVDAARVRIAILAAGQCGEDRDTACLDLELLLPNIKVADGGAKWNLPRRPSVIVVNPPFAHALNEPSATWAQGRTSQAAIFIARCLEEATDNTVLAAILPDVLRTGTRYKAWRHLLELSSKQMTIDVNGRFDKFTDVDVFLLKATLGKGLAKPPSWGYPEESNGLQLRDLFHIHVGPVVPFRLTGRGPWRPYVHAELLPVGSTARDFSQHIRFEGTTYLPPFVLVRRTSKSDYKQRCVGTLVVGEERLAVENHLLILVPKNGTIQTCEELLSLLNSDATTEWMNQRIRCRHLTVGSVGELPWIGGSDGTS